MPKREVTQTERDGIGGLERTVVKAGYAGNAWKASRNCSLSIGMGHSGLVLIDLDVDLGRFTRSLGLAWGSGWEHPNQEENFEI